MKNVPRGTRQHRPRRVTIRTPFPTPADVARYLKVPKERERELLNGLRTPPTKLRMKSISQTEYGWHVRVIWRGKQYAKHFSSAQYGGSQLALVAAAAWRDETEKKLGKPRTDRVVYGASGSGVRRRGHRIEAIWFERGGIRKTKSFSVRKHGLREAKRRAVEARRRNHRRSLR